MDMNVQLTKGFWRHEKFVDVFVEVLKVIHLPHKTVLKVKWWNKGYCNNPMSMGLVQKIEIKTEDVSKWHKIQPFTKKAGNF